MGGCSFARHGSYARATPRGCRIARWDCPESHRTFSLLPDFLAARLPGLLASIEDDITVASSCKSMEAAADVLRGPEITLAAAIRWLRRRVQAVRAALEATARFVLNLSDCILGEEFARGVNAGRAHTLYWLRVSAESERRRNPQPVVSHTSWKSRVTFRPTKCRGRWSTRSASTLPCSPKMFDKPLRRSRVVLVESQSADA
jgi:hypothetical protein